MFPQRTVILYSENASRQNMSSDEKLARRTRKCFTCVPLVWNLFALVEVSFSVWKGSEEIFCGSYFILNLSKQACNWKGKNFLILFHKLNLFEILRLHLQSVASVYLLEKNKCFERKPPPFHHIAVLFTLLDCKWNWSREWQRYRVTQVNDVCKLLKLRNDKN